VVKPLDSLVRDTHARATALPSSRSEQQEMDEVIALWRKAAEHGYIDAQFNLGSRFYVGDGLKKV
jgi:TPR repeat protein